MNKGYQIVEVKQELTVTKFIAKNTTETSATNSSTDNKKKRRTDYAFPLPKDFEELKTFCDQERMLKIFNKFNHKSQKKFTKTVQDWFLDQAKSHGWHDVEFIQDLYNKKISVLRKNMNEVHSYASVH